MSWLVGLPLGIFKLLVGLVMLVLRLAVPILLVAVIVYLARRFYRQPPRQDGPSAPKEPHFDGPVYTVDYEDVDEKEEP